MFKANQYVWIHSTNSYLDGKKVKVVGIAETHDLGNGKKFNYYIIKGNKLFEDNFSCRVLTQACLKDTNAPPVISPNDVMPKLINIVVEHLGVEGYKITPTASFVDDLCADSLDEVELVMAVEEAFDIEISDGELEENRIVIVQDAINLIQSKLTQKSV